MTNLALFFFRKMSGLSQKRNLLSWIWQVSDLLGPVFWFCRLEEPRLMNCPKCNYDAFVGPRCVKCGCLVVPGNRDLPWEDKPSSAVRALVFEIIVRQAMAGTPWKEVSAGPMYANRISAEEIEAEVERRRTRSC